MSRWRDIMKASRAVKAFLRDRDATALPWDGDLYNGLQDLCDTSNPVVGGIQFVGYEEDGETPAWAIVVANAVTEGEAP